MPGWASSLMRWIRSRALRLRQGVEPACKAGYEGSSPSKCSRGMLKGCFLDFFLAPRFLALSRGCVRFLHPPFS